MASEPVQEYPAEVVRGTFFEHDIPVDKMFVHFRTEPGGYARPLREWRVNKLQASFDRQALGVILLSLRDNGYYALIDGQHRWETARRLGLPSMDALVYIDLSLADEARLYRKFGDYLKQTPLDRYHAGVAEGMPEYLAIQRILQDIGLHVPHTLGATLNSIDAVDALVKVATIYGPDTLNNSLRLLHDAWGSEHRAYRSMAIHGAAMFLTRFQDNPNFHRKRFIDRLTKAGTGAVERHAYVIRDANLAPSPNSGYGQALLQIHDRRVPEGSELGDWPKRSFSELTSNAYAERLRKLNAAKTPEALSRSSIKAAETRSGTPTPRSVRCAYCHAAVGNMCFSGNGNVLPNYHTIRRQAVGKVVAWTHKKKTSP